MRIKTNFNFSYSFRILVLLICINTLACQREKKEFSDWYSKKPLTNDSSQLVSKIFYSKSLAIDTIYRSMQGPFELKLIELEEENEELLWIVGYEVNIIDSGNTHLTNEGYMCHSNLNYYGEDEIPWKIKTSGNDSRIFTLSEGQTKLDIPEGFGIPIPNGQSFELTSQVLNHNFPDLNIEVRHQVEVDYIKDSQADRLKPLYQQSVFITKQTDGPAGEYGLPVSCVQHNLDSASIVGKKPNHNCEIDYGNSAYNPYYDGYGRKYTGHWKLPVGEETLKTDVTGMLDLSKDTKIHMIAVHLHPFAKKIEFWDKTSETLIYEATINAKDSLLGFKKVNYLSSEEGVPVYKDHKYELISTYNCTDSVEIHTAMATMYLYLEDI